MRVYSRPRVVMGVLDQAVADPTAEVLAAPPSVQTFMMLIYMAMLKVKEAVQLVADGNLDAAKQATFSEYPKGVPNPTSALGLYNQASKMIESLYRGWEISETLFDGLSLNVKIPAYDAIGGAMSAISRGESGILRMWDSWFGNFDAKADRFLKSQAEKYIRLYRGIDARNKAMSSLTNKVKAAPMLANTATMLPYLERDLEMGLQIQKSLENTFAAEAQVTPAMLRGEQALGQWGTVAVRSTKFLKYTKIASWLGPILAKLGLSAAKSLFITKVIYWIGKPILWLIGSVVIGKGLHLVSAYVVAWVFAKGTQDYEHYGGSPLAMLKAMKDKAAKDKEVAAKANNKPAEKTAEEILAAILAAEKAARDAAASAERDFPGESGLGDTQGAPWLLYALGAGALAIGLYLYFSKKNSQPVAQA